MNRRAVELAVKTALALDCGIHQWTKWDRKNYYYPDLPKGYQISQFDLPLSHDGYLPISVPNTPGCHNPARRGGSSRSGSASSAFIWRKTPARACTTSRPARPTAAST